MTLIETLMDGFQGGSCAGAPKPKIRGGGGNLTPALPSSHYCRSYGASASPCIKKLLIPAAVSLLGLAFLSLPNEAYAGEPKVWLREKSGATEFDGDVTFSMACGASTWVSIVTHGAGGPRDYHPNIDPRILPAPEPDEILVRLTATGGGAVLSDPGRNVDPVNGGDPVWVEPQAEASSITVRRWNGFWGKRVKKILWYVSRQGEPPAHLHCEDADVGMRCEFPTWTGHDGNYFHVKRQCASSTPASVTVTATIVGRVDGGVTTMLSQPLGVNSEPVRVNSESEQDPGDAVMGTGTPSDPNPHAGLIADVRGYAGETENGDEHVRRWQRVLKALGETDAEFAGLELMTAVEAQTYADKGWTRWEPVVAALTALESGAQQQPADEPEAVEQDEEPAATEEGEQSESESAGTSSDPNPHAGLIADVRGYAGETENGDEHVRRWQRVLKALGETDAEFAGLEPMTAAEAQTYADKGWARWEPVAAALTALESGAQQQSGEPAATEQGEESESPETEPADDPAPAEEDEEPAAEPELSVSDASGPEGKPMKFTITLSPPAEHKVRVRVETRESSPVSAGENRDYQRNGWWVYFEPGETEQHRWIRAFDDSHDDSGETFEFVLSRARGAVIADAVGVGTIINDDPLPGAYLSRFGRAVAEQALGGIAARMEAPREPGAQGRFAGHALSSFGAATPDLAGAAERGADGFASDRHGAGFGFSEGFVSSPGHGPGSAFGGPYPSYSRSMTLRDALLASSFTLTGAGGESGGSLALWGQSAQGRFSGREDSLSLHGETITSMLGADYARGRWLAGLALTRSASEGGHRVPYAGFGAGFGACPAAVAGRAVACGATAAEGDGEVEASLTAVIPYVSMRASERITMWGAFGHGTGEVRLAPALGGSHQAGTAWRMAAAGLRGDLMPLSASGPALAVVSDALWTRTSSEEAPGLAASDAAVSGFRFGMEGSWRMAFANGMGFVPRLEMGLRHDGGDAETGLGVELGGGFAWSAPSLGLMLDVAGRTLLMHENSGFKDSGLSVSLAFDPDSSTGLGPSFSFRQDYGGLSQGGLDMLFAAASLEERTASAANMAASRWTMETAWGFPAFGGRFTASPHAGFGRSHLSRDYSIGWRLMPETASAADLSFGLRATRRESDASMPENAPRHPAEHLVGFEIRGRW